MEMVGYRRYLLSVAVFMYMSAVWGSAFAQDVKHGDSETKDVITVVADPWCPYTCGKEEGKDGVMVDLARAALASSKIRVDYKIVPWSRAIDGVRAGEYHAIVGAAKGDAPDFVFPHNPQAMSLSKAWVVRGNGWKYTGVASLAGKRVGAIADYYYGSDIANFIQTHQSDKMALQLLGGDNALELNLRKLKAGRIDVFIEDENVIRDYFAKKKLPLDVVAAGNVTSLEKRREEESLYVAFSPVNSRSKEYAQKLEVGMENLRRTGALQEILRHYGVEDWQKKSNAKSDEKK